jgi:membrane-associated phospholipid phosphatase
MMSMTFGRAWAIPLIPLTLWAALVLSGHEVELFLWMNQSAQILPNWIWAWFTFLGNGWGVFALCFPLLLFAPRQLCTALLSGGFAAILSLTLKPLINLPRPAGVLLESSFTILGDPLLHHALPSGHTLTVFSVASALFFATSLNRRNLLFILFVLAVLTGISRSAVGAHWPGDILVGSALGIWCGLLATKISSYFKEGQFQATSLIPRFIAIAGIGELYVLQTTVLDFPHNQLLQHIGSALVFITLILFVLKQNKPQANV